MPGTIAPPSLDEIAETYQEAISLGLPPAKSVESKFSLPRTTASKKIRKARQAGLIPEDSHPKHSRKLVAVADALGISPDDLVTRSWFMLLVTCALSPCVRMHSDERGLITAKDLSAWLAVPCSVLANWRYLGSGPKYVKVGRLVRYRTSDVETWLEENTRTQT